MARTAPGREGSVNFDASSEPRSASTTALPFGKSPTVTGNRTPRKSEKMPNHEVTMEAAFSASNPGRSEKTTGKFQECWLAESKNGTGSKARSLGRGNRVPFKSS